MIILKWLPFLAKFAGFAKWFSWLPGGQIIGILGSIAGLVVSFFRWLVRDIEDAFKEPQRLLVRLVCFLAVLAIGVHQGIKWDARYVAQARYETKLAQEQTERWRAAHQELLDAAKAIDGQDKTKHQKAVAAKLKAEAAERVKIDAEQKAAAGKPADTATAVQPNGVQPKRATKAAHCQKRNQQESLFGNWAVFGGSLSCKST